MPGILGLNTKRDVSKLFQDQINSLDHFKYNILQASNKNYNTAVVALSFSNHKISTFKNRYILTFLGDIFNIPINVDSNSFSDWFITEFIKGKGPFLAGLNGQYQAAIYDLKEQTLFLITDHSGSRPVYYSHYEDTFSYACEVKAIISDPLLKKNINNQAIANLFSLTYVGLKNTLFSNVFCLNPASILTYKDGKIETDRYYYLPYDDEKLRQTHFTKKEINDYIDKTYFFMDNAVKKQIDQKKIFIALSGGLDSRFIAAIAHKYLPSGFLTYTFGNQKNYDILYARKVADVLGTSHLEIMITPEEIWNFSKQFSYLSDGMSMINGPVQAIEAINKIKNKQEILLAPQVADAMWGSTINKNAVKKIFISSTLLPKDLHLFNNIFDKINTRYLNDLFEPSFLKELTFDYTIFQDYINSGLNKHPFYLYQLLMYYEYGRRGTFSGNLMNNYFFDMRMPSYDIDLIEFASTVPIFLKQNQFLYRKAFSRYFPALAKIPREGTRLPLNSPDYHQSLRKFEIKVINRLLKTPLSPFFKSFDRYQQHAYVDYKNWFKNELNNHIREILFDPQTLNRSIYKKGGIEKIYSKHMNSEIDYSRLIWQIINLEYFYNNFNTKDN